MKKPFLEAGQIVNTHGVAGEVKIMPWADGPEFLLGLETVYLGGAPRAVEQSRVHKGCVLMKLRGVDTVEDASALRDTVVSVSRADVQPPEGAVFIADLLGLPVYADGVQIGVLDEVLPMPGNDVYVVKGEHEYMIPAVPEFLERVDADGGRIDVRLIEGMRTDEI